MIVIPEMGMKTRIVQSCSAGATFVGHQWRAKLNRVVFRPKSIRLGLGPESSLPLKRRFLDKRRIVFSSDLSEATDRLNRDVIDKICQKIGLPPETVYLDCTYYKGTPYPVRRGTMMGLPCSWLILSIVHDAICRYVDSIDPGGYYIRGDDLIAYWTLVQVKLYKELMEELGFGVNDKKSFRHPYRGWFCEQSFIFRNGKLEREDSILPLRSFCRPPDEAVICGSTYENCNYNFAQWGPILQKWDVSDSRKFSFVSRMFRSNKRLIRKFQDILFLPSEIGGLDYPCPNRTLTFREKLLVDLQVPLLDLTVQSRRSGIIAKADRRLRRSFRNEKVLRPKFDVPTSKEVRQEDREQVLLRSFDLVSLASGEAEADSKLLLPLGKLANKLHKKLASLMEKSEDTVTTVYPSLLDVRAMFSGFTLRYKV
jgi:hypothetical protein